MSAKAHELTSVVVIGGSQGGVQALLQVVSELPDDLPAAILAVVHIGSSPSMLPSILSDLGKLPASHAKTGEQIKEGHVYVAPPDHHLLVSDAYLHLSHGPRENGTRPAIDPLFRTAARAYGAGTIGVILTGGMNDGTAGLREIKNYGGTTIVQDPSEAEVSSMPQSALENVPIDYCTPLSHIPPLLVRLISEAEKRPGKSNRIQFP